MELHGVYRLKRHRDRLVVNLQHPILEPVGTWVVAPLYHVGNFSSVEVLNPRVEFGDVDYSIAMEQMSALKASEIGEFVASLSVMSDLIQAAMDLLFRGE